jgi:hypothetical protein
MEEKFFGNHRSNDPTEVAFVEFLKRVNEKENFVETNNCLDARKRVSGYNLQNKAGKKTKQK